MWPCGGRGKETQVAVKVILLKHVQLLHQIMYDV